MPGRLGPNPGPFEILDQELKPFEIPEGTRAREKKTKTGHFRPFKGS